MSQSSEGSASMENLSALVDGELGSEAGARACAQWREDSQTRASWHAYALIGDVMRSEDLASRARKMRDLTVPIGQFITSAISS